MSDTERYSIDRRTMMKTLGAASFLGMTGAAGTAAGEPIHPSTDDPHPTMSNPSPNNDHQMFRQIPAIDIPVIDGYHECETVWFIHTSASSKKMAQRMSNMINHPVLYVPKLDDIAKIDALADIYVFKNGVDRSDAEPWGGGLFGYQIDILDSVPGENAYTPLRHPNVVKWAEDADPEIIKSVDELMAAQKAGRLTITPTEMVVTAPVVSWPGDPFGQNLHMAQGPSDSMKQMMEQMSQMMQQMDKQQHDTDASGT